MNDVERIYLNVDFPDKDQVKKLGAWWDAEGRGWWVKAASDLSKFSRWLPRRYRPDLSPPYIVSEMIPAPCWHINLRSLLPKNEWDRIRRECYEASGYRCQVCGQRGRDWPVECNEQWQFQDDKNDAGTGIQKLLRVTALCPSCHKIKHLGRTEIEGLLEETLSHLARINGWSADRCEDHASEAFEVWEQRCEKEWRFDLSILRNWGIDALIIPENRFDRMPEVIGVSIYVTPSLTPSFNNQAQLEPA